MNRSCCQPCEKPFAVKTKVSYPALAVCCTQSPVRQAWVQTRPGSGSVHSQWYQMPIDVKQHNLYTFVFYTHADVIKATCSSSSSLFFLLPDWFLWGNKKSSAAVGTPGNTATKSCSSGKSETYDKATRKKKLVCLQSDWCNNLIFIKHLFFCCCWWLEFEANYSIDFVRTRWQEADRVRKLQYLEWLLKLTSPNSGLRERLPRAQRKGCIEAQAWGRLQNKEKIVLCWRLPGAQWPPSFWNGWSLE